MAIKKDRETRNPSVERAETDAFLRDIGANEVVIEAVAYRIDDEEVQSVVSRLKTFAEKNPRIVLGALSALIAGGAVAAVTAVKKKKTARKTKPRASSKRTLIEPHPGDKRYIRRDAKGRIKESDDVGRSLAADRRRKAKTRSKSGSGDKGDR